MAYDRVTNRWDLTLRARGVVLLGAGDPIVLCAVDWLGIANGSHDEFRDRLARAAATKPERVAVHTLHQHDAPESDFTAEAILKAEGLDPRQYEGTFQRQVLRDLEKAITDAIPKASILTHVGFGSANVHGVASNRRILGADGKVKHIRWTATPDPVVRAEPDGVIDPKVMLLTFWNNDRPLAALSYYATHPQSYYRTGVPNPDFPGLARFLRQLEVPDTLHVHFAGAGGNIGAGKYNDGSKTNRIVLAQRLADGMKGAWVNTTRVPVDSSQIQWVVREVNLPVAPHLSEERLQAQLKGRDGSFMAGTGASRLAFVRRMNEKRTITVACLRVAGGRVLHMPGELFVEYQLEAQKMRSNYFVAMAAYGDYGTAYIGTRLAYDQGGYETGPNASNVAPEVEAVLTKAIEDVIGDATP